MAFRLRMVVKTTSAKVITEIRVGKRFSLIFNLNLMFDYQLLDFQSGGGSNYNRGGGGNFNKGGNFG